VSNVGLAWMQTMCDRRGPRGVGAAEGLTRL
jgi:hypothetical protein